MTLEEALVLADSAAGDLGQARSAARLLAGEVRRLSGLVELADRVAVPFEEHAYCAQAGLICMRDEVEAYLTARGQR